MAIDKAKYVVTTPGATKFYRSAGSVAHQQQVLQVADGASLEWLPQENIYFPGARVGADTRVELSGDARRTGRARPGTRRYRSMRAAAKGRRLPDRWRASDSRSRPKSPERPPPPQGTLTWRWRC